MNHAGGRKRACWTDKQDCIGQTNGIAVVLSAYLQSTWQSLRPWGNVALPRSSAVTVLLLSSTACFRSLSLSRKLLVCLICPFRAVKTRPGETTKHKYAAQSSLDHTMVHQREQRRQLTQKEIWGWYRST